MQTSQAAHWSEAYLKAFFSDLPHLCVQWNPYEKLTQFLMIQSFNVYHHHCFPFFFSSRQAAQPNRANWLLLCNFCSARCTSLATKTKDRDIISLWFFFLFACFFAEQRFGGDELWEYSMLWTFPMLGICVEGCLFFFLLFFFGLISWNINKMLVDKPTDSTCQLVCYLNGSHLRL